LPPDYLNPKLRTREVTPRSGSYRSSVVVSGTRPFSDEQFTLTESTAEGDWKFGGTQSTVSEGHPFRGNKSRDDVGGPFDSSKMSLGGIPTASIDFTKPAGIFDWIRRYTYSGPILPIAPSGQGKFPFPPPGGSSDDNLDEAGARAIARIDPGNPIMSLSTTLGELYSEGLPHLVASGTWKRRNGIAHKAGSNYLNTQFGWLPLVSDVRSFIDFVNRAGAVIKQYERDAGRRVRRRYDFPIEKSLETSTSPGVFPYVMDGGNYLGGPGVLTHTRITSRRQWFSGAFTYFLPTGYNARSELDRVRLLTHLLGVDPSPETMWNLTPWSWAVDWFSNAGDVIQNVSSFQNDGHVLAYGYVMENTTVTDTYSLDGCTLSNGAPLAVPSLTLVTETKARRKANPYGFGVSWDGLSPFQGSIIAALGITRYGR